MASDAVTLVTLGAATREGARCVLTTGILVTVRLAGRALIDIFTLKSVSVVSGSASAGIRSLGVCTACVGMALLRSVGAFIHIFTLVSIPAVAVSTCALIATVVIDARCILVTSV